jgi:hypothetical protein
MKVVKKPLRAETAGRIRLSIELLEDRVIPGETLNAILFWQMGLSPIGDLLGPQAVADGGSSRTDISVDGQAEPRRTIFEDEAVAMSVPSSVADVNDVAAASETARTPGTYEDSWAPPARVETEPTIWSPESADVAMPSASTAETPALIPPDATVPPSTLSPHAVTPGSAVADTNGPAAGQSGDPAISVAPPVADTAAATTMLQAQPAGHSHGGGGSAPYSPAQIRHAYGFDQLTNNGAGQTIAIVDAFDAPTIASDLDTFSRQFGLPTTTSGLFTFSKVFAQGSQPSANASWAQETSLDVEWAHAIAPQANIMLVETASASSTNLFGGVDYAVSHGAHIVSMSWGFNDSIVGSAELGWDSHFNAPGVTFLASSGDTGSQVYYPSASPYVVSVGGTSLHLDSSGNLTSAGETAWSSGGGGASVVEPEPGYQTAYGISLGGRGTPDVSYNADPNTGILVYDSTRYLNMAGWLVAGGTSAGAPQWAGLVALVDQGRATPLSGTDLTASTSPFYTAATAPAYASNYRDITSGSNGHTAVFGYDLATGVGSPLAASLVPFLTTL